MRWKARLLAALLAAGFAYGLLRLFNVQFATGEVYPEYSSMRADPTGSKLLFDSLARMPGLAVSRNFVPLEYMEGTGATILLLSMNPSSFEDESGLRDLEKAAERGNRIVAAMTVPFLVGALKPKALGNRWHVTLGFDANEKHVHHLYFKEAQDWSAIDRVDSKILAIERGFDKGSVVLVSESDAFSNESTIASDRLDTVSAVLGGNRRIVFDEQHFGIVESGSVMGLARRYRLMGLAFGLAVCAALFIWKNASPFPPPAAVRQSGALAGRTSLSGLLTLLRRHIPPAGLPAACWHEWLATHRREVPAERLARAEAIARGAAARPLEAMREIQDIVRAPSKGTL